MSATHQRFISLPPEIRQAVQQQLSPYEYDILMQMPTPFGAEDIMQRVEVLMNAAAANYRNILLPWPLNANLPCLLSPAMTEVIGPDTFTVITVYGPQAIYTYNLLRQWWDNYVSASGVLQEDGVILPDELMVNVFAPTPPASILEMHERLEDEMDCQTEIPMTPDVLIYLQNLWQSL
jgi:hypothetical protein